VADHEAMRQVGLHAALKVHANVEVQAGWRSARAVQIQRYLLTAVVVLVDSYAWVSMVE
jgi:hypothetical protein